MGSDGSGRIGSRFCRIPVDRLGSSQHFVFYSVFADYFSFLNVNESLNTTFGLIVLLNDIQFI